MTTLRLLSLLPTVRERKRLECAVVTKDSRRAREEGSCRLMCLLVCLRRSRKSPDILNAACLAPGWISHCSLLRVATLCPSLSWERWSRSSESKRKSNRLLPLPFSVCLSVFELITICFVCLSACLSLLASFCPLSPSPYPNVCLSVCLCAPSFTVSARKDCGFSAKQFTSRMLLMFTIYLLP